MTVGRWWSGICFQLLTVKASASGCGHSNGHLKVTLAPQKTHFGTTYKGNSLLQPLFIRMCFFLNHRVGPIKHEEMQSNNYIFLIVLLFSCCDERCSSNVTRLGPQFENPSHHHVSDYKGIKCNKFARIQRILKWHFDFLYVDILLR